VFLWEPRNPELDATGFDGRGTADWRLMRVDQRGGASAYREYLVKVVRLAGFNEVQVCPDVRHSAPRATIRRLPAPRTLLRGGKGARRDAQTDKLRSAWSSPWRCRTPERNSYAAAAWYLRALTRVFDPARAYAGRAGNGARRSDDIPICTPRPVAAAREDRSRKRRHDRGNAFSDAGLDREQRLVPTPSRLPDRGRSGRPGQFSTIQPHCRTFPPA
jgi:hypothetical protein